MTLALPKLLTVVIPKPGALQPGEGSRAHRDKFGSGQFEIVRARFLAPRVKARGFGMTPFQTERTSAVSKD